MNFTILTSFVLIGLLRAQGALASGCAWYTRYELGSQIFPNQSISGTFTCSEYFCTFKDQASGRQFSISELDYMPSNQFPPTNQTVSFPVDSFEAMAWSDCDGGDPVPPYVRNGTLWRFFYSGHEFDAFVPLK